MRIANPVNDARILLAASSVNLERKDKRTVKDASRGTVPILSMCLN